jgi:DNA-binding NtrC family response regulator
LLFRLNTVEITVPSLRKRRDDILPIARHYATIYSKKYDKSIKAFSAAAEEAMLNYDWPGNVRALRHSIERAIILAENDTLDTDDLQLSRSIAQAPAFKPAESAALNLDQIEKRTIETALRKHAFNISHAAKELGLTRASLYRRMEKHGL